MAPRAPQQFMYVWNVYGSGTNIQSTTAIIPFPSNADNEEVKTLLLPPMKWCVARRTRIDSDTKRRN